MEITYKIETPNKEFSKFVQIELFKLGVFWLDTKFESRVILTHASCLYIHEKGNLISQNWRIKYTDMKEIQFASIYKLFK